jgi:predicted ATP-dependent serine protease
LGALEGEDRLTNQARRYKCRSCGDPASRLLGLCSPCKKAQVREWRASMTLQPTRQFPGVDIDAIHRKRS